MFRKELEIESNKAQEKLLAKEQEQNKEKLAEKVQLQLQIIERIVKRVENVPKK